VNTSEIKCWNDCRIISEFYFTCNHVWNWSKIISAAEWILKLFQNYFSDNEHVRKYSSAAISLWNNFEIISGKFPWVEIKLFQTDVDKGWHNFEITISHVTTVITRKHHNILFTQIWLQTADIMTMAGIDFRQTV